MCAPLVFTPAPALLPPTLAFTPTPHCDLQHFSGAFCLHDPQPSQQHPVMVIATATAVTTAIGFTFMAYLTFFDASCRKPFPVRHRKCYSFFRSPSIGAILLFGAARMNCKKRGNRPPFLGRIPMCKIKRSDFASDFQTIRMAGRLKMLPV